MGFWQTGYMEFHEPTGEGVGMHVEPRPAIFLCSACRVEFLTERDLRVHRFEGHPTRRPILVFRGRECGSSRLTITCETSAEDWAIRTADTVSLNGAQTSAAGAIEVLSSQRSGIVDVRLTNNGVIQTFQFEFTLADEEDLNGVDAALERLIDGAELSLGAINDFIMRSKRYPTAATYMSGLSSYLYGVLAREKASESGMAQMSSEGGSYDGKYDKAVGILGRFDRAPAEAICGIVAFHYNQFDRAMTKTKSRRVAEVSFRFQALLRGESWPSGDLSTSPHSSLDFALSDSVIEQVLRWSAQPLDGTAHVDAARLNASFDTLRPSDAVKLHLVAAEQALAARDLASARSHAECLRHSQITDRWYADFQTRVQILGA